ncbi:MAG TPA: ubiquitin-like domain-containing protein [Bacillota bacterium]|nr:ubiquitin-like domain-containing protein [Bacillota bacterium]
MKSIERLLSALKPKLVFPSVAILAIIVLASLGIYKATQATVVVAEDGKSETIKTHAKTVKDLFDALDINVNEHDDLSEDLHATVEDGMEIEFKKAKHMMLTVDDQFASYYTTAETVEQFLDDEDVEVTEHDELSHRLSDEITEDIHIQVTKAYPITIFDGKEKQNVWTVGGTVEELLEKNDIKIKKHDKVKPNIYEQVFEDRDIKITRVNYEEEKVEETIDYKTERIEDDTLEKGKEKVVTEGEAGKLVKTYRLTFENGEQVKRKKQEEKVTKEPTNKVIAVGTKEPEVVQLAQEKPKKKAKQSTKEPSNGKEFTMHATAYTANCNGCSGYTATGINIGANPNKKVVAVDPSVIPLGSRVWVEGYGEAIAGDTGGSISGNRIDVHVPDKSAAYSFGTRTVKVKVLD